MTKRDIKQIQRLLRKNEISYPIIELNKIKADIKIVMQVNMKGFLPLQQLPISFLNHIFKQTQLCPYDMLRDIKLNAVLPRF